VTCSGVQFSDWEFPSWRKSLKPITLRCDLIVPTGFGTWLANRTRG